MKDEPGSYVLTAKTVSFHNDERSAWVIVDGVVYDVTLFLESHPGGAEVLKGHLGGDVTEIMRGGDGGEGTHGHSQYAYKLLSKYRVGSIAEDDGQGHKVMDGNVDPATGKQLVDWNKAILPQVGELGDKYFTWIHSFPTTDSNVKMFQNDTIENLTKCPWYVPPVFWTPITVAVMVWYFNTFEVKLSKFSALAVVGYLAWLLFEYSLHRFVFHLRTSGYWGNIAHFLMHGHHHITPLDYDRLVFPPAPALLIGGPIWAAMPLLLGSKVAYPLLFGFVVGYLVYDMTHFFIHYATPKTHFLKDQKSRHVHHHYLQPNSNFGISNPLFDHVFGTLSEGQ